MQHESIPSVMHLLVVDDDARIRRLLCDYLRMRGAKAEAASSADEAAEWMRLFVFDVVILDRMMPGCDGETFLRRIRAAGDRTPVIMLTARGETEDRISGLEAGADDYVPKPFDPKELWLRARNLATRGGARVDDEAAVSRDVLRLGSCQFHRKTGALLGADGVPVSLSERERAALLLLAEAEGEPVTREALAESFDVNERSADVLIARLRKTLRAAGAENRVRSVRNVGYALVP